MPEHPEITDCPIIFASCKSNDIDKVIALGAGGDDYITKPFSGLELVARIKAHLRRNRLVESSKTASGSMLEYQDIKIDTDTYEVHWVTGRSLYRPRNLKSWLFSCPIRSLF